MKTSQWSVLLFVSFFSCLHGMEEDKDSGNESSSPGKELSKAMIKRLSSKDFSHLLRDDSTEEELTLPQIQKKAQSNPTSPQAVKQRSSSLSMVVVNNDDENTKEEIREDLLEQ